MSVYALSKTFQRLKIVGRNVPTAKYHTVQHVEASKVLPILLNSKIHEQLQLRGETIAFNPRSISLDINLPTSIGPIKSIIDTPFSVKWEIEDPLKNVYNKEDKMPEKSVDLPTNGIIIERHAAIPGIRVIRRKKMKKHRRKKFRKRMKYKFMTINKRRGVKRERLFQAELWAKVKEAEKFNAEEYVASRIELLTKERLPPTFRGEVLPEAMIKQFIEERNQKREKRRNRLILTLD